MARSYVSGTVRVSALLAFFFGLIFVAAILIVTTILTNPEPWKIRTFTTILALAGAGIASVVPGYFELKNLPLFRAGGALAVFVLIFLTPTSFVAQVAKFELPTTSPDPLIEEFFARLDTLDVDSIVASFDPVAVKWYGLNSEKLKALFENAVKPLGRATVRKRVSEGQSESPAGFPPGIYHFASYLAHFDVGECRSETVVLRATDKLAWTVFTYQVSPVAISCVGVD